jgi:DNA excision repair protein ERCC-4
MTDLIIDSNERGALHDSVIRKAESQGLQIEKKVLVIGDYLLGNACVEAKSISDLFQSSHSGHLWRQLDNMDANYQRFFLLIHGGIDKYVAMSKKNGKKLTYTRVQNELIGTIARVMSDFDCQVFFTPNLSEAALFIVKLHNKLHKPASAHGARAIRRVSTNDVRKDMLLTIPGVGSQMVDKLLSNCGSIEEMCFPESLKLVKGLGAKTRERIIEVLSSEDPVHVEASRFKRID